MSVRRDQDCIDRELCVATKIRLDRTETEVENLKSYIDGVAIGTDELKVKLAASKAKLAPAVELLETLLLLKDCRYYSQCGGCQERIDAAIACLMRMVDGYS